MSTGITQLRETLALAERQLRHAGVLLSRLTSHVKSGIECAEVADRCREVLDPPCHPHHAWVLWTDEAPPPDAPIFIKHESRKDLIGSRFANAANLPTWVNIVGLWWRRA